MADKYWYLELNELMVQQVKITMVDAVSLDENTGMPTGITPYYETEAEMYNIHVTVEELAAVGLTAADVPNLTVIDTTETKGTHHV